MKLNNNAWLQLKKSLDDSRLEYFKREILAILNKQEKEELKGNVKKSFQVEMLKKSMLDPFYMAKANYGLGHVSTYIDGSMWKKVQNNPPKWKCIRQARTYSSESRGAKLSIAKLKAKVRNCTSTDELLDIVMFSVSRFTDENGKLLPIVEELKKEVEGKRKRLNAGKTKGFTARLRDEFNNNTNRYLGKDFENIATGIKAVFSKESQKEIRSNVYNSKKNGFSVAEHFEVANQIKELFENATLENEHEDTKHNEKDVRIERFLSKEITLKSGKKVRACITVKHSLDKKGRNIYSLETMDIKNALEKTRAKGQPKNGLSNDLNISHHNTVVKLSTTDFPEEFNKGKWKKNTKMLIDFMNSCKDANPLVMSVYKVLGKVKNSLPFSLHGLTKKLNRGAFQVAAVAERNATKENMKPVKQALYIEDIDNSNDVMLKKSCSNVLHEVMHMIDFSSRLNKDNLIYRSENAAFTSAIDNAKVTDAELAELERLVNEYNGERKEIVKNLNAYTAKVKQINGDYQKGFLKKEEYDRQYDDIKKKWDAEYEKYKLHDASAREIGELTDIYDAITGGDIHDDKGFGGHGRSYYKKTGNRETEIMANVGALSVTSPKLIGFLESHQPEVMKAVYNVYNDILNEVK